MFIMFVEKAHGCYVNVGHVCYLSGIEFSKKQLFFKWAVSTLLELEHNHCYQQHLWEF